MGEILKEQGFQLTGACDDACVVEIGKLVGVIKIIAGSVGCAGTTYTINIRLIDVATGRVEQNVAYDNDCDIAQLVTSKIKVVALTLAYKYRNIDIPDSLREAKKKARGKEITYLPYAITGGLIGASVLAVSLPSSNDEVTTSTAGFAFLRIPVKARPAAMGEAVVAVVDDASGLNYNPAGLPLQRSRQVSAGYLNYVSGIQAGNVAFIQPLDGSSAAAAGLTYLNSGDIKETTLDDPLGEELGSFSYSSAALSLGYGRCLHPQWFAGAAVKGAYEKVKEYSASGVAVDAGLIYEVDLQSLGDRLFKPARPGNYGTSLALGAAVQNIGFATKAFVTEKAAMPLLVRAGLAYRPFLDRLTVALAGVKPVDSPVAFQAGGEYWIRGLVALRLGYNGLYGGLQNGSSTDDFSGLAAGLGVRYHNYRLDFAYTPYGGLGNPMRVDVSAAF